ncbi:MAG TPA: uroporphyrinogen decarboxylase family protein [Spirochaetales bacterium]|nr:uroporphyrinogen decarboxylase family protein [Spirochaetales bacterium]
MNKRERLQCAMNGQKPDRVPVSIYQHSTVHNRGVDEFTTYTINFYRKFDPDYVKVMYDELYDTPVNYQFVSDPSVWSLLEDLDPHEGALGRYLLSLKKIRASVSPDTPVIATIFSPLHIAIRLAWGRIHEDYENARNDLYRGLKTITSNLVSFVSAAKKEAGIDGFFVGAYGAETKWFSQTEYVDLELANDKLLLEAMKDLPFVILHIHGEHDSYFDLLSEYDCTAFSWEDRLAGPDLASARKKTPKCLVGGIDHVKAKSSSTQVIYDQAREAIAMTGGAGFVLSPGCTFLEGTPIDNMLVLKTAAEDAAKG